MEGDWNCTACGQHNYASRIKCFVCGESAPEEVLAARPARDNYNRSATDWECPDCGEVNFARRDTCRACSAEKPEGVGGGERGESESYGGRRDYGDGERGDRRSYGDSRGRRDYGDRGDRREYAPRERREYQQREPREYVAKEGDWTCPSCGDVNYAFRTECRKCQASKP
jgi:RNA-binding protein FUS